MDNEKKRCRMIDRTMQIPSKQKRICGKIILPTRYIISLQITKKMILGSKFPDILAEPTMSFTFMVGCLVFCNWDPSAKTWDIWKQAHCTSLNRMPFTLEWTKIWRISSLKKGGTNILTLFPQQAATPNIQIYWVTIFEMEKIFPTA